MAFLSKVGKIFTQSCAKQIGSDFQSSRLSIFQTIRCMSTGSKVFVGGLSYGTDDQSLREAFNKYGDVVEARVIIDRDNGRSRGFGFVTFTSNEEASSAIQALDGQDLHGRNIRVNYATERARSNFGVGGNYGSGSYGSGGGGGSYGSGSYGSGGGGGSYGSGSYGGGGGGGSYGGGSASTGGDNYFSGNSAGGNSSFSSGGFDSSSGSSFTGDGQSGSLNGSGLDDVNYRDNDDNDGDYAKRA